MRITLLQTKGHNPKQRQCTDRQTDRGTDKGFFFFLKCHLPVDYDVITTHLPLKLSNNIVQHKSLQTLTHCHAAVILGLVKFIVLFVPSSKRDNLFFMFNKNILKQGSWQYCETWGNKSHNILQKYSHEQVPTSLQSYFLACKIDQ